MALEQAGNKEPGSDKFARALQEAREAQSVHVEAVENLRNSQELRLALLRDELSPHIASHPKAAETFTVSLAPGASPRLWLDLVSYVVMAPDARTYRLIEDRRDGRHTVHETASRADMVTHAIGFMAHRLIERERALAMPASAAAEPSQQYGTGAMVLAWLSGFSLGVLVLFAIGVWLAGSGWK